jgi:hypothetical protein
MNGRGEKMSMEDYILPYWAIGFSRTMKNKSINGGGIKFGMIRCQ